MIIGNFFFLCIYLGLFSLKKKIEDAVVRAEMLAPTALELEEASQNKQEAIIRGYNLWDDPAKSNELLTNLADTAKVVDALKDLTYKVMCNADYFMVFYVSRRIHHSPSPHGNNYDKKIV